MSEDRFWRKVDQSSGPDACWPWTAYRMKSGYGQFGFGGKMVLAHRHAYDLVIGPIPGGMLVCHTCDNPPCCNPAHLWLGTDADNAADRDRKGRCNPARGERHGTRTKPESYTTNRARGERNGAYTSPERVLRGERHGMAKLTDAQVREIRRLYAAGGVSLAALGRLFGVTYQHIQNIVRGKNWKHVDIARKLSGGAA